MLPLTQRYEEINQIEKKREQRSNKNGNIAPNKGEKMNDDITYA